MKNKFLFLIFVLFFIFVSCTTSDDNTLTPNNKNDDVTQDGNNTQNGNNDDVTTDKPKLADVSFINESSFDVNIYIGLSPTYTKAHTTVNAGKTVDIQMLPTTVTDSDTFYFEYLIDIGNAKFPYYSGKETSGYKIAKLDINNKNEIIVQELKSCPTDSSYFLIENKTKSEICLKNGNFSLQPFGATDKFIAKNSSGTYELANSSTTLMKIAVDATNELPLPIETIKKGNIYTMTVTADSVSLKAVTPFDLDTRRQIWSRATIENTFTVNSVRPTYSKDDGFILTGTKKNEKSSIYVEEIDFYGEKSILQNIVITSSQKYKLENCMILDFLQTSNGNIVMLLEEFFYDNTNELCWEYALISYNFDTQTIDFSYTFPYNLEFRSDCKSKLIETSTDCYAVVGGLIDNNGMHHYIATFDCSGEKIELKSYTSSEYSDYWDTDTLQMFTSVIFDGANYIVCGYENCDFNYSNDKVHRGVVYKINKDLSSVEKIYSRENCLFFGIDKSTNGKYYICGEYTDNGNILKGLLLTSDMIKNESQPLTYSTDIQPYTWFTQSCVYSDKIILCGQTASDMNATKNSYPLVMAIDFAGKKLWENTTFAGYTTAYSCIPNKIGTYIIQLYNQHTGESAIVSSDLLGADSGVIKKSLP